MKIYAFCGFKEFLLALGDKGEVIKRYFLDYYHLSNSLSITLKDGIIDVHSEERED